MDEASIKQTVDQVRKNKNGQVVLVLQGGGRRRTILKSYAVNLGKGMTCATMTQL